MLLKGKGLPGSGRVGKYLTSLLALGIGIFFGFGIGSMLFNLTNPQINQESAINFFQNGLSRFRNITSESKRVFALKNATFRRFGPTISQESFVWLNEEAQTLGKKVKVMCLIMTYPKNLQKAWSVQQTWAKRCNKFLFLSSKNDTDLGAIEVPNVKEGKDHLWTKTKETLKLVYKNYMDQADWFLKADDDTYVIVENLRYMLKDVDPNTPIYYGCRFKPFVNQGYMAGGAGYVLSKEALKRFVEKALPDPVACTASQGFNEDIELARCMENVQVAAGDARDEFGRHRFLPFLPEHHIIPGIIPSSSWYWKYLYYPQKEGMECCSDTTISFHYVPAKMMFVFEYFLYHLTPFGISHQKYQSGNHTGSA